jgi:transcription initiation factor TFIID subunit 11
LTGSFTPLQADRYEKWNRTRLRKETLRRIVNHALSQSVPQSVVTVVNGFTKVFIGEIIEKARTVQEEWAEAYDLAAQDAWVLEQAELQVAEAEAKAKEEAATKASAGVKEEEKKTSQSPATPHNIPAMLSPAGLPTDHQSPYASTTSTGQQVNGFSANSKTAPARREFVPPVNPHRGQLLPDHIREALRRYKRAGEGHGTGMSGLSQPTLGARGAFTLHAGPGGRRLFR